MFEARGLTVRFGSTAALSEVSFAPSRGTTVLIGPSGCGKSTLLRALIGLVTPETGDVLFNGAPVGGALAQARHATGYVIQSGGLFPHLTARRNVTLLAEHLGRAGTDARVAELAALVRLEEALLARYPAELSGGQRQRVSLMRALMLDPGVLLLDEPLGGLDPMVRAELQRDLRAIFRALGKTVVMVTHDLAEAAYFADRVVLLREGHIEQRGAYRELLENPASDFVREFVSAQRELHSTDQKAGDA
jgi:osmoprotectant transport system ATP-binding protein